MKLIYLSDLHLELITDNKLDTFISQISLGVDEVCVLAGDIGNPYEPNYDKFMTFINVNFKKSFVIAGNHEYYNKKNTIHETKLFMIDYLKKFENISFLDNMFEYYENYCFIGTTLWSEITNPIYTINDIRYIPNFNYIQYNTLHKTSVEFLENAIQSNENCIVITHQVPSNSLIDIKYKTPKMRPYNQWFYCNMDNIIETNRTNIKCWIYGHTHTSSETIMNGIPFLCNPVGYTGENSKINFNKQIIV